MVHVDNSSERTVRIYSDAMYTPGKPSGVAFVAFLPATVDLEARVVHSAIMLAHNDVLDSFDPDKKQYIEQLELLAAIAPYFTIPEELRRARVIHWVDNTGALAGLIKGYSAAGDAARLIHVLAAQRLELEVDIWFQWVPSKANIADLPSRSEFAMLHRMGSTLVSMTLPEGSALYRRPFLALTPNPRWGGISNLPRIGSIAIGNLRTAVPRPGDVSITRGSGSPLANPFPIGPTSTRSQVCTAYEALFRYVAPGTYSTGIAAGSCQRLLGPSAGIRREAELLTLARQVARAEPLRLLCACYPRQCHATTVARLIREKAHELRTQAEATR